MQCFPPGNFKILWITALPKSMGSGPRLAGGKGWANSALGTQGWKGSPKAAVLAVSLPRSVAWASPFPLSTHISCGKDLMSCIGGGGGAVHMIQTWPSYCHLPCSWHQRTDERPKPPAPGDYGKRWFINPGLPHWLDLLVELPETPSESASELPWKSNPSRRIQRQKVWEMMLATSLEALDRAMKENSPRCGSSHFFYASADWTSIYSHSQMTFN